MENSFMWYINRLRMMPANELVKVRLYRTLRDMLIPVHPPKKKIDLNIDPFDRSYKETYLHIFNRNKDQIIMQANEILSNNIKIFGKNINFGNEIHWHLDYISGKIWPLDIRNYRNWDCDPKYIWEINRNQFLPVLGKAYMITNDEVYAGKIVDVIRSWIDQNPPFRGINWKSGIEASLRQISWIFAIRYISGSKSINSDIWEMIRKSFYLQTMYVRRHLSLYSSANNHLISELAGIVTIGSCLGQTKWTEQALNGLIDQIDKQILDDGVGAEQSPAYLLHTMEYYILACITLMKNNIKVPKEILDGLIRGSSYIKAILYNGNTPNIGDNDSGEVLRLAEDYSNYKSILNITSIIADRPEYLQEDWEDDEKLFWLLGPEMFEKISKRALNEKFDTKKEFPVGGYYIIDSSIKEKSIKIIFDCGPLGMKPMAGHGHADSLSLILFINDVPFIIDPGTYTYFGSGFWRNYFRGTSAHNTIRIDKMDQSIFTGRFMSIYQAESVCAGWKDGRSVTGIHKGYMRLKDPVEHCRTISVDNNRDEIRVEDTIQCKTQHFIEQYFHFHPDCEITSSNNSFSILSHGYSLQIELDRNLNTDIYKGDESIPLGWYSQTYGIKERCYTLAGRCHCIGNVTILTNIKII